MDLESPKLRKQPPQAPLPTPQHVHKSRKFSGKKLLMWLVMLAVIAGAAFAGYYYRHQQALKDQKADAAELVTLRSKNAKLEKDLADAKKASTSASTPAIIAPTQAVLDNIEAAINTGNYAAL